MINNRYNQQTNEESLVLLDIQKLQFAIYDLSLYLDTHPNDPVALYKHRIFTQQLQQLRNTYEERFGMLSIMGNETGNTWRYINSPWPWER